MRANVRSDALACEPIRLAEIGFVRQHRSLAKGKVKTMRRAVMPRLLRNGDDDGWRAAHLELFRQSVPIPPKNLFEKFVQTQEELTVRCRHVKTD